MRSVLFNPTSPPKFYCGYFDISMTSWTPGARAAYNEYKQVGPLWMRVEDALGEEEPPKVQWQCAASNFLRLINEIENHPRRSEFEIRLTRPQKISWKLLTEWWTGQCQRDEMTVSARLWINHLASTVETGPVVPRHQCPGSDKSLYHSVMSSLFEREFLPSRIDFTDKSETNQESSYTLPEFYEDLHSIRKQALLYASIQKLAFRHSLYTPSSKTASDEYQGATLDPCSWISLQTGKDGLPYYLWDIAGKRTVVVTDLSDIPAYSCISHTWGRWRIRNASTDLQGVPWPVPRNTRFDVEALPEDFAQHNWKTPYIWFDLFCIPQDGSELANVEIARQSAIFRNASSSVVWLNDVETWHTLPDVIAWLALSFLRTTSSPELYDVEQALSKAYQDSDKPIELMFEEFIPVTEHQRDRKMLSRFRSTSQKFALTSLNGWFSSLWTLQEAFLCPGSALCSKQWEPLRDRTGHIITLDTLFALQNIAHKHVRYVATEVDDFSNWRSYLVDKNMHLAAADDTRKMPEFPLGVKQLTTVSIQTKLDNLWDTPTPTGVLVLGNMRQCTESRAQAIMCIIGATDWYTQHLDKVKNRPLEDDLVMGLYPLSFVKEAALKLGAHFYCTVKSAPSAAVFIRNAITGKGIGSMLPFSPGFFRGSVQMMNNETHTAEHFPDVSAWQVQRDGSVKVSRAGIVAASSRFSVHNRQERASNGREIQAWVIDCHRERSSMTQIDLSSWLNRQSKLYQWYAVALCRDSLMQSGIILKSAPYRMPNKALHLVKTGYFRTIFREFPVSECVNWTIL